MCDIRRHHASFASATNYERIPTSNLGKLSAVKKPKIYVMRLTSLRPFVVKSYKRRMWRSVRDRIMAAHAVFRIGINIVLTIIIVMNVHGR